MPRSKAVAPDDYPGMLNRSESARAIQSRMRGAHDLLLEELKYGLGLAERAYRTADDSRMKDSASRLLWLYLESLDSVDALLRVGAVNPATVQARSMLDIGIQLLYLLKQNDERLAMAYTTHRRREKLREAERTAVGGQQRRELEAKARRTKHLPEDFIHSLEDTTAEAERIRESLTDPLWREANEELNALHNPDRWFSAFGGPRTILDAARAVEFELWYDFLYRPWSGAVHGSQPEHVLSPNEDGSVSVRPLRDARGWEPVLIVAHVLNYEVYGSFIKVFRPGEEESLKRWIAEAIHPMLNASPLRRLVDEARAGL